MITIFMSYLFFSAMLYSMQEAKKENQMEEDSDEIVIPINPRRSLSEPTISKKVFNLNLGGVSASEPGKKTGAISSLRTPKTPISTFGSLHDQVQKAKSVRKPLDHSVRGADLVKKKL